MTATGTATGTGTATITAATATPTRGLVTLPFSTVNRFSAIDPFGEDVDFYRFRAKAGEILAIETVPGRESMDTFIGLFDSDGNLLIADDDSGAGLLSRLLVHLPADGTYAVGVTTFGDTAFTGRGDRLRPLRPEHQQLHRHAHRAGR